MSGIIGVSPSMKSGVLGKYPDGHVLQVVTGTYSTEKPVSTSSFESINSALEPTITVTGTNKVFVMCTVPSYSTTNDYSHVLQIYRGSTALGHADWGFGIKVTSTGAGNGAASACSILDTPGAGTHTYKIWHRSSAGTSYSCINGARASITLMEISA